MASEVKTEIRVYAIVDRMQPQYAAISGTVCKGGTPIPGMAELYLEVAPGSSVLSLLDAALKAADVRPGFQVLEREFGQIEVHSQDIEAVREAGRAMLDKAGVSLNDRIRPEVVSEYIVSNVTPHQAQIINRNRLGSVLVPGQSLFVMEVQPAGYIVLAANAAERGANISLVSFDPVGRFGRLYLSGKESEVRAARNSAITAIEDNMKH